MKLQIESKELLRLLNDAETLRALEQGGVDNWQWYGESIDKVEEINDLSSYGGVHNHKYVTSDKVYYNNNEASFVTYLSEDIAVVNLELMPNLDVQVTGTCQGCLIGDSDNKLSCTCEDTQYVLEEIESNTEPTIIPLTVGVKYLYDNPLVISKHEKELEVITTNKNDVLSKTKELKNMNIELEAKNKELEDKIKAIAEFDKF